VEREEGERKGGERVGGERERRAVIRLT